MNPAWITIVSSAIAAAIDLARKLGHEPPGVDKLGDAWADLNAAAGKLLPAEVAALAFLVQRNAAAMTAAIDSLPEVARCRNDVGEAVCDNPLTRHIAHSPHTGKSSTSYSCDACGWEGSKA